MRPTMIFAFALLTLSPSLYSQQSEKCYNLSEAKKRGTDSSCQWDACTSQAACGLAQQALQTARREHDKEAATTACATLLVFADPTGDTSCAAAQYDIGTLWEWIYESKDPTHSPTTAASTAHQWYQQSAKAGYLPGMYALARCYHHGINCHPAVFNDTSAELAYKWYNEALTLAPAWPYAQYGNACCMMYGWGCIQNLAAADELFRKIIETNPESSQEEICLMAAKKRGKLAEMFGGDGDSTDGEDSDTDAD